MKKKSPTIPLAWLAKGSEAQTAVEFALVLPVFLLFVFSILEVTWLARNNLLAASVAREGARSLIYGDTTNTAFTAMTNRITPVQLRSKIRVLYWTSTAAQNGSSWSPWAAADSGTNNGVPAGDLIKVQLILTNNSLTGLIPLLNNQVATNYTTMKREAN